MGAMLKTCLVIFQEFHIVPIPNPDGYVYTWETDRYWYKNRQILGPNEKCIGLDMNRNWRGVLPKVPDPCSHWYPGHRPFESPEVNNIANYITTLPALKAYVDLRSYGQMLSIPYSFHCKKAPKDAEDLMEAALGAVSAIKQVHGTAFTSGSLCSMLYKAPGNVVDWMYARAGVKFSYSVFLRDTGTYGFSLPAEWIRPVGEETANMIQFLAGFISSRKP
ncbi:Carboxypeptidase A2 [Grifola frondosa]|uniref:Carboxypeptidase A2 n=1 Tax=Grifola frondosa TaxID=5627 RepID=A0A1C7MNK9_GRIFR|nr:Carboxypeptidase A2 [Grifola frondosa]